MLQASPQASPSEPKTADDCADYPGLVVRAFQRISGGSARIDVLHALRTAPLDAWILQGSRLGVAQGDTVVNLEFRRSGQDSELLAIGAHTPHGPLTLRGSSDYAQRLLRYAQRAVEVLCERVKEDTLASLLKRPALAAAGKITFAESGRDNPAGGSLALPSGTITFTRSAFYYFIEYREMYDADLCPYNLPFRVRGADYSASFRDRRLDELAQILGMGELDRNIDCSRDVFDCCVEAFKAEHDGAKSNVPAA